MHEQFRLGEVLLTREQIGEKVKELAAQVANDFKGQEVLVVGILTGAVFFLTDLVRELPEDMSVRVDFISVSSYANTTESSGVVRILHDLKSNIEGKNVLIVEDIIDTGLTLNYLLKLLKARKPANLKVCVLLDKPSRRKVELTPDYYGFSIPDEFVVGCGLDCANQWRHLKDIHSVVVTYTN